MRSINRNIIGFCLLAIICICNLNRGNTQSLDVEGLESEGSVFVDGISPVILGQGDIEVSNTSAIVSYWNKVRLINLSGGVISNTYRLSIFQNRTSINYGFSGDRRWDLGAELFYLKRRWDDEAQSSPFKVLSGDDLNRGGLAYLGLKGRAQPFANIPELTMQATLRIPVANGDQLRRELGAGSMQFSFISTYYNTLNYNTSFLLQGGWTFSFPKTFSDTNTKSRAIHTLSLGGFTAINLWGQKIYAVPGISYSGNFRKSARSSDILQLSHGVFGELIVQFHLGSQFSITLQQSYPFLFESYSPTVEFERRSFSLSTLGIRGLF